MLKDVFKPKASTNNSSKNPKFYNQEKNRCIDEGATNKDASIRKYFASSSATPTKVLTSMLEKEQDKTVLREILFNSKLPRKSVAKFVNDENDHRVEWFSNDEELINYFKQ